MRHDILTIIITVVIQKNPQISIFVREKNFLPEPKRSCSATMVTIVPVPLWYNLLLVSLSTFNNTGNFKGQELLCTYGTVLQLFCFCCCNELPLLLFRTDFSFCILHQNIYQQWHESDTFSLYTYRYNRVE